MKERVNDVLQAMALLAAVILLFSLALCAGGCRSTGALPCPETPIDVVGKNVPVPCIVLIEPVPAAALPPLPPFPQDADEERLKTWALALGEALEARAKVLAARDAAWLAKVQAHNEGTPLCSDVAVQPAPP